MVNFASLAVVALSLAAGQVLFKRVGLAMANHVFLDGLRLVVRQPALYVALTVYGFATLLWIWVLSRVPLVQAYPWVAASAAIVPLMGRFIFGERVAPIFWVGVCLILVGIFLTQIATESS
jgi:multidrug transporter EmrE-like cation transporter